MPDPRIQDYHIGWICALKEELTAAIAMLDQEYETLAEQEPNDNNSYVLGRIHSHNVVLACLSTAGLVSAATVAQNMARTFPALRFGLLVGIGGGMPNLFENIDIRLGDVVVSQPLNSRGGVVQYDMGKAEKGGSFKSSGHLNSPPSILQNALTNIQARRPLRQDKIFRNIEEAIVRHPGLQENGFTLPTEPDCLYCKTCDRNSGLPNVKCNERHIERGPRSSKGPIVHYGTVASGNQVIKDAFLRDRLRDEYGALCVEMEAAGLMNDFPCLVVRGICDYADSHKNNAWHGYAALAAAAYTKDMLRYISSVETGEARPIHEISDLFGQLYFDSREQLDAIRAQMQDNKIRYEEDKTSECLQSLKVTPYEVQKNINPERVPGTCQWVLNHSQYIRWKNETERALLWISADPGCGKSVLAKALVDHDFRTSASHTVCYFFFKDNGEQDRLSTALCSLLHQLYSHRPNLVQHAMSSWRKTGNGITKESHELWRILLDSTGEDGTHSVTCVLDAIDECRPTDRSHLIRMLTKFCSSTASSPSEKRWGQLKFLVTSRPYEDIEAGFRDSIQKFPTIRLKGEDENDTIHQEIDLVVRVQVNELAKDLKLDRQTSDRLLTKLLEMQHRTYLWLYLTIDGIRKTRGSLLQSGQAIIETLPSTVEDAYEKILQRIPKGGREYTKQILRIIVAARRPLTIGEMAIALGIATSQASLKTLSRVRLRVPFVEENIRLWCGLFVFINHGRIHLIHQTAKEFLIARDSISEAASDWKYSLRPSDNEELMARICTVFLWSLRYELLPSIDNRSTDEAGFAFLEYSAVHWPDHFRKLQLKQVTELITTSPCSYEVVRDDVFLNGILRLYNPKTSRFNDWFHIYAKSKKLPLSMPKNPICVVACLGHGEVLAWLSRTQKDYNPNGGPLAQACRSGHENIVRLLLQQGADIAQVDDGFECINPLCAATEAQEDTIVGVLLEHGSKVNTEHRPCGTALTVATRKGYEGMIQTLLDGGANVNTGSSSGNNPLCIAFEKGYIDIVWMLLEAGADLSGSETRDNPLYMAARDGHVGIVKWLCEHGADVNAKTRYGRTALQIAAKNGYADVVRRLLYNGADPDGRLSLGVPSELATRLHRHEIVSILTSHATEMGLPATENEETP